MTSVHEAIWRRLGEDGYRKWLLQHRQAQEADAACIRRNAAITALEAQGLPVPPPRERMPIPAWRRPGDPVSMDPNPPSRFQQMYQRAAQEARDNFPVSLFRWATGTIKEIWGEVVTPKASACECGSAKLGYGRGPQHSNWCPWSKP